MLLAGDVGGTNARLALFDAPPPADPVEIAIYSSAGYVGLAELLDTFVDGRTVSRASFGVAGPVQGGTVEGVNLAWDVDGEEIASHLGLAGVGLLNDLEANAWGIAALGAADFAVINEGVAVEGGNAAVISAGTGLGEAGLLWNGQRYVPFATEGGHADFAPRTEQEVRLWRSLGGETRHVSVESVCSGEGLVSVFEFLLSEDGEEAPGWLAEARGTGGAPAQISVHAIDGNDERAGRALELMVSVYGAEAGNLALVTMATAGIYVGGGIAPKILPVIEDGTFMDAFCAKGRLEPLLADIPVRVILNDLTALYGAALHAASHEPARSS